MRHNTINIDWDKLTKEQSNEFLFRIILGQNNLNIEKVIKDMPFMEGKITTEQQT